MSPNVDWIWTPAHEQEIVASNQLLLKTLECSPPTLTWPRQFWQIHHAYTGWVFGWYNTTNWPLHETVFHLIQWGSSALTSAQGNYATIELVFMVIQYTLPNAEFYLPGLPTFEVWTDHRPLVGIFSKTLHLLINRRLMRMRKKIMDFNFTVKWIQGKTHYMADALSNFPVFQPHKEYPVDDIAHCRRRHLLICW